MRLRNRIYYLLKPLVPPPIRMAVRQWFAFKIRERAKNSWPIQPGSEKPPQNWPGWPDGKKFAFVLTHDVEGPAGLAKCRQLMNLEMKLGFRSSFNFIPDGPYSVSRELRDELTHNGFEVGVHDLNHDGKLFRNRKEFAKKAARINEYLKEWEAVGFRSGFMLRNREWIHDLNLAYDASTFDTDPFEPQPDGTGTIFPFWIQRPSDLNGGPSNLDAQNGLAETRQGYVELPYTLPQDSTLFVLFQERNPDIWFQKLDWIASRGGMALLDTHPDYINFENKKTQPSEYPVEFYQRFLEHVKSKHNGQYWHALPREVATCCQSHLRANAQSGFSPIQ